MVSVEMMKERARIAGRFNLSARRNPEHRALVALAAQKAGGECNVIPVAPGEDEADTLARARKVSGGQPVIIVTETDGELCARILTSGAFSASFLITGSTAHSGTKVKGERSESRSDTVGALGGSEVWAKIPGHERQSEPSLSPLGADFILGQFSLCLLTSGSLGM